MKLCFWCVGPCSREGIERLQRVSEVQGKKKNSLGEMNFDTYSSLSPTFSSGKKMYGQSHEGIRRQ